MKATREVDADVEVSPAAGTVEPKRNRQHERSQMSTTRLLAAAAELFADRGYRQTSLADIGKQAGYSHGLVTRRFGSKQGLLIAMLDHMINNWMERELLPAVANQNGIEGIRAFFGAFCANATANSNNLRALESLMFEGLWGEPELKERLIVVQQHGQERFLDLIQNGIKAGTVRAPVDANAIALMAGMALRGATYCWLLDEDFDLCAALNSFGDVLEAVLQPND
jgi:AcrR family transcriptional regulator